MAGSAKKEKDHEPELTSAELGTSEFGSEKDDIQKIMSEIEGLQQEMNQNAEPTAAKGEAEAPKKLALVPPAEAPAKTDSSEIDMTANEEAEPREPESREPESREGWDAEYGQLRDYLNTSSLSMGVKGNITVILKFEDKGLELVVDPTDEAIHLKLSDGTEFKVPYRKNLKKAA